MGEPAEKKALARTTGTDSRFRAGSQAVMVVHTCILAVSFSFARFIGGRMGTDRFGVGWMVTVAAGEK